MRIRCAAIAFAWVVCVGASGAAQHIAVTAPVMRVATVGGQSVGPILSVAATWGGRAVLVGGPTRQQISVIDRVGNPIWAPVTLQSLGIPLGAPAAATLVNDSVVVVIDGQSSAWARLAARKGILRADTVATNIGLSRVSGTCSLAGRVFVMAKRDEGERLGIIHERTTGGQNLRSFARPFTGTENPAVGYGDLLCSRDGGLIIASPKLLGAVRAYTASGQEKWAVQVPEFRAVGFERIGRRVTFVFPPDSVWDEVASLFLAAPGVIAIQVGRYRGRVPTPKYAEIQTWFLSAATGKVLGSQGDLPIVLAASKERLFAVEEKGAATLSIIPFIYRKP